MEYCEGGALIDLMHTCNKSLTEDMIAAVVAGIVQGLVYLHTHKLVHRDIKAGNVLLTAQGIPKLADCMLLFLFFTDCTSWCFSKTCQYYRQSEYMYWFAILDGP